MVNIALARKVLDHIERFPENHFQAVWCTGPIDKLAADNGDHPDCGTTLCFAGWTAFLTAPKGSRMLGGGALIMPGDHDRYRHAESWALQQLDLSTDQADALFFAADYAHQLKAMVDKLEEDPASGYHDLCVAAGL